MFKSIAEMMELSEKDKKSLHEVIILKEMEISKKSRHFIEERLQKSLRIMKSSLENGVKIDVVLPIREAMEQSKKMLARSFFLSKDVKEAVYWAMSIIEYSCGMGLIVAAPTAGSCGVLPATLFKAKEMLKKDEKRLFESFIVGSAIGVICGNRATISGSEGGCQAEIGVASAMAAASIT
ncbi:MAG: hypothetical protein GF364_21405, partial [Candidatus Lokiarchaeota archaeon]|nr:hypothetical protein [Candidatus Lokiarchaeota archaeon]